MILRRLYETNGWKYAEYQTTWPYGWDFMLDAVQEIIDIDLLESDAEVRFAVREVAGAPMQEITDEVEEAEYDLRDCETLQSEWGVLMITGVSPILKNIQIQVELYNQTGMFRIGTTSAEIFDESENALTTYICSMEIKAYCADTERRVIEAIRNGEYEEEE